MTPGQLRSTLKRLGLSQVGASRLLRVSDRSVRLWIQGAKPVPFLVGKVLAWMAKGKVSAEDLAD